MRRRTFIGYGAAMELPAAFLQRLEAELGTERASAVAAALGDDKDAAYWINPLREGETPRCRGLGRPVSGLAEVFVCPGVERERLVRHTAASRGRIYLLDPSSVLAVQALAPQPGEAVLDLAAAPGGEDVQRRLDPCRGRGEEPILPPARQSRALRRGKHALLARRRPQSRPPNAGTVRPSAAGCAMLLRSSHSRRRASHLAPLVAAQGSGSGAQAARPYPLGIRLSGTRRDAGLLHMLVLAPGERSRRSVPAAGTPHRAAGVR